ncbi:MULTISPECIES: hypothetical protein [unclassified Bradyrhizobium]|uniref:hypothetical protein n=1 Tax=unclassified Bradyrhizobium TaxID=2631580 RepID=UPI0028E203C3|nr:MULTISPECIES: hypothetical protein [unclassified Bradyrhizobium]
MTSRPPAQEDPIGFEAIAELADAQEKQVDAAGVSLRETAKWIVSGIAVAAAGVVVGTSLSSLGAFGFGVRLVIAVSAIAVGFIGLGVLFGFAIKVIAPPSLTLQDFADSRGIPSSWKERIELRARPFLKGLSVNSLEELCEYLRAPRNRDGSALSPNDWRALKESRRLISLTANSELRRLLFDRLVRMTYVMTPLIAVAVVVFAWAANPPKDVLRAMPVPVELDANVHPEDLPQLIKALGASACVEGKLHVIVLDEWRSGIQEVVTVPKPSCPPVRLLLNQGRISPLSTRP